MNIGAVTTGSVASAVWTVASRSLTTSNGLIFGQNIQPASVLAALDMTTVATTNIFTYSGTAGVVMIVGKKCTATLGTGIPTAFIDIITESVTSSYQIYDGTGSAIAAGAAATTNLIAGTQGQITLGDLCNWSFFFGFNSSVTVRIRITATTATLLHDTFSVMWAHV
jgi:hypothetical protein